MALGGTGIFLSDGATNVMPVPPHRGDKLTAKQNGRTSNPVHRAWKTGVRSYAAFTDQWILPGWDLKPAQLRPCGMPTHHFFLSSYADAVVRLRTLWTGRRSPRLPVTSLMMRLRAGGLLNFFLKAMNCGAISEEEAAATGLTLERNPQPFVYKILEGRRAARRK